MSDEECPHGLDASWCSLCKAPPAARAPSARSAGPTRSGSARSGGPSRAAGSLSASRPRRTAPPGSRFATSPRVPAAPLSPAAALARLRPALFHASALGAWDSIRESGLRTSAKLLADAGRPPTAGLRERIVEVDTEHGPARLRDQRLQVRSRIEAHLDGVTISDWLAMLDERVHFFAKQKDLTAMLARYQSDGQDLLVFDTARTLAVGGDRVEVATVPSGAPEAWSQCRCRGRDTFLPLPLFEDSVADVEEVTIVDGLDDVTALVSRVVRYHPDRTTEVIFERGR